MLGSKSPWPYLELTSDMPWPCSSSPMTNCRDMQIHAAVPCGTMYIDWAYISCPHAEEHERDERVNKPSKDKHRMMCIWIKAARANRISRQESPSASFSQSSARIARGNVVGMLYPSAQKYLSSSYQQSSWTCFSKSSLGSKMTQSVSDQHSCRSREASKGQIPMAPPPAGWHDLGKLWRP